jgi:monoterpene epsilon-lactone hydrolase
VASQQAEAMKDMIRTIGAELARAGELSLEEQRANAELFAAATGDPTGVTWTTVDAGGIPAIWADPEGGAKDRVLQYVHGGGYIIGSADAYRKLTGHLAKAIGCRVLNVDYGLAPENPHPGPVNDSFTAYRWLLDQKYEPRHLAIAGDSAGGGLTLATLLKIRDSGLPQPAAAVPISPWVDMEALGESWTTNAEKDLLVKQEALKGMVDMFLAGGDPRDPLAAPLYGDYKGICPLYIQVGGDEALLDDSTRVAERARAAGVDVRLEVFPEMQHVFQMAAGNVPEADDAVIKIGAYLGERLGLR